MLLLFVIYIIFSLAQLYTNLSQNKQGLAELRQMQQDREAKNEELKQLLENGTQDDMIEHNAREKLDYVYTDEEVYVDISGN